MSRSRQIQAALSQDLPRLEDLPQAVVAFGRDLIASHVLPFHHHRRAQLIYASSGVMTVTTVTAAYVVPPRQAVWMPGGTEHRIEARSDVAMRTVYVEPGVSATVPDNVCVLEINTLLHELIVAAVECGPEVVPGSAAERINDVILDQIARQRVTPLFLPMPRDQRLSKLVSVLIADPGNTQSLDEWAMTVGASKRTLGRLFTTQTGMTFTAWRTRCRLLRALELLATGANTTKIALDLGYDSPSAFIAMFRRYLGTTPSKYLAAN